MQPDELPMVSHKRMPHEGNLLYQLHHCSWILLDLMAHWHYVSFCRDSVGVKISFGHAQICLFDLLEAQKSELCFLLWATDTREKDRL